MIAVVGGSINFVTELTSNTATTQMILPILASLSRSLELHPLLLMIPAALSASCAFMLPVATPPNAIIYGSGQVPIGKMIRAGIILNLTGIVLTTLLVLGVAPFIFDISFGEFPAWAASP
jgi:sodium-dependent dicarboxylate transporter 2/3/5